ncbi:MAG: TRAP transporter small permease subunit [Deltaproteobacteria bacterium]|jgi:TRAP-type mannitol/chloroaromatic compound transport system permease small subunit|nr:TRAP transporter small permease subunit [SAR324 cluster bacterium]MEC8358749.1 TRAP transporter small permease subunit [SAR324 cluster bacterium]
MRLARAYIQYMDRLNWVIGRCTMYGIFLLMGVLFYSSISKTFFVPSLWTLEMAQFVMVGYYVLGGPYSLQLGSNVRMDLLYGSWPQRRKSWFDLFTVFFLIFYLCVLLYGAIGSTAYSLGYFGMEPFSFFTGLLDGSEKIGMLERSSSAWHPYLWPVKVVMIIGITLMLLQCISEFLKDILRLKGELV